MSKDVFSFDPDDLFPPEKLAAAYGNAVKAVRLLLARIAELEAEIMVMRGTLARPDTTDDGPVTLIEGTPNAPR